MWTDDPVRDADRYFAEQERRLSMRPVCRFCGEHIQDGYAYEIPKVGTVCEQCIYDCKFYIND